MIGHTFPLLEVTGSAYEMGYQHGAQATSLIERYLRLTERLTGKPRDQLCRNAMTLLPYMTALSPTFVEEVRGLAAGADISLDEAVLCQARAEAGRVPEGGCTAFAITGSATADGQTLAGQNQDLEFGRGGATGSAGHGHRRRTKLGGRSDVASPSPGVGCPRRPNG